MQGHPKPVMVDLLLMRNTLMIMVRILKLGVLPVAIRRILIVSQAVQCSMIKGVILSMKRNSAHTRAQRLGKERDLHTCQVCGSTEHTEGHHIIDFIFGGAADEDNIITLCHNCHVNVHRGRIDIFKL